MQAAYKMKSYWLKCWKDTENINPRVSNTSNGRKTILSKCAICGSKNSRFIKDQVAKGLLSNLGVRTSLSKVPIMSSSTSVLAALSDWLGSLDKVQILGDILFSMNMLNGI